MSNSLKGRFLATYSDSEIQPAHGRRGADDQLIRRRIIVFIPDRKEVATRCLLFLLSEKNMLAARGLESRPHSCPRLANGLVECRGCDTAVLGIVLVMFYSPDD
jgi:hypothetical protein